MRIDQPGWRNLVAGVPAVFGIVLAVILLLTIPSQESMHAPRWLCLVLVLHSLALVLNLHERHRPALWLGLLGMLAGSVIVAGYLLAFNGLLETPAVWGFRLASATDGTLTSGIALLALGAAVIAVATRQRHDFALEILVVCTLVITLMVPGVLLVQHYAAVEASTLAHPLTPEQAVLLLAAGLISLVQYTVLGRRGFDMRHRFLPALAFATVLTFSLHLWLVLVVKDQLEIRQQTAAAAQRLDASLAAHATDRLRAIERLAGRMVMAGDALRREPWEQDVGEHLDHFESISTMAWVSEDQVVRWAMSQTRLNYQEGERYAGSGMRQRMLDRALATGTTAFSDPLSLGNDTFGQIVATPLIDGEDFRGWLVTGLRYTELLQRQVGHVTPAFAVRIDVNGIPVYARASEARPHPLAVTVIEEVHIGDLVWVIRMRPEREFFANYLSWLPGFMLLLGVLAAMLFGFSLYQLETQRRRTARLRDSEERFRLVAEQTGEIVYDYDIRGGRIEWSGASQEVMRMSPEEMNRSIDIAAWERHLHPDDADPTLRELERAQRNLERFMCEYRFRRADGTYVRLMDRGVFLPGPDGAAERMLGTLADVTERHEMEAQFRYLAHFDQQTGLRNRVWFMEDAVSRIEAASGDQDNVWFVFMDVDRFKAVNETLGHAVGDLLLEAVARRLEAFVDNRGVLARLGGDEFAVCIHRPGFDREAVMDFCESLMREIDAAFTVAGHSLFVTLSAGVACYPHDGDNAQQAIRAAETAMFRAKQRGKNTYAMYEASMSVGARENLEIANALRRALETDEFHLVFQPRYSMQSGRITGMEALLRWESSARGNVPPAVFIPIAEETGLIGPIGWYVVDAAAAAACQLGPALMHDRRIAINVSARQLTDDGFVPELVRRVKAAGAVPTWFELELTETLIMEDPQHSRELLGQLHEAGFTISIDDFGTGYSSLSYLKHFAVDNLKIDRSFVTGLPENSDDAAIVRTIIRMGQGLGLRLVAEGIETEAQGDFLRDAGCQEAQGYFYARPMSLAQVTALLE